MVYDLGGGTFDISIMMLMPGALSVLGTGGNPLLGGDNFDELIMQWWYQQTGMQQTGTQQSDLQIRQAVRTAAERCKIQLSDSLAETLQLPFIGPGFESSKIELTRQTLESLIGERVDETMERSREALKKASLSVNDIDHVLLVGGSSLIPLVQSSLAALFGVQKLRRDVNPMECVGTGAALQSALLDSIQCSSCQGMCSIHDESCHHCGRSLVGSRKVNCPNCCLPCEQEDSECWKCGASLNQARGTILHSSAHPVVLPAFEKCPGCGTPYQSGIANCVVCGESLREEGGLKCSECGAVNRPGVSACAHCGADMSLTNPIDITPKPIGIELDDGRFSVILDAGTVYPTPDLLERDYFTSVAGQRLLEVMVYEGEQTQAKDNELIGIMSKPLPDGLPRGSRVKIALGFDENRKVIVRVTIPGSDPKMARLARTPFGP